MFTTSKLFDVKTITNTYANKDLKDFNDNMVSLDNISPMNIATHLTEICKAYRPQVEHVTANPLYVKNEHVFDFIKDIIHFIMDRINIVTGTSRKICYSLLWKNQT